MTKALLKLQHMSPLADFAQSLRKRSSAAIPDCDPLDGGTGAEALFLFEKPGPKAFKSGFISRNNDDKTAENIFNFMAEARIPRECVCLWNVIPGWNGTTKVNSAESAGGLENLREFIELLPGLRVAVLVGRKAERATLLLQGAGIPWTKRGKHRVFTVATRPA